MRLFVSLKDSLRRNVADTRLRKFRILRLDKMIACPDTFVMPYCEVKLRSGNPEISLLPMSKVPFAPAFPSTSCRITLDDQQPMKAEARNRAFTHCLLNGYLGGRVIDDFESHLSEFLITSTTIVSSRCE